AEVFVFSPKEKTLGVSRFEDGRLTFPQALPTTEEPAAFELADLDGDGSLEIVYISRQREGRSSAYALRALKRNGEDWQPVTFAQTETTDETTDDEKTAPEHVPLALSGTPERMLRLDANADGRPDFLVFAGAGRPPQLVTTGEGGRAQLVETRGGIQLGEAEAGAVFTTGDDEPSVLVAQQNFARRLRLDDNLRWAVLDQYNAPGSGAEIVGAATLDLDGQAGDEIVLVDTGIQKLRILREEENLFRPWKEVETGDFPYQQTQVADLNGDGRDDLVLIGRNQFAVLYAGRTDPSLKETASFETKLEDTHFADLAAGDLNADGRTDVVLLDTQSHMIEILDFTSQHGLRHALHFKLFEAKSFAGGDSAGTEPREAAIADVTGDGRSDLVLLTHDRVLVYPQDAGDPATASQ
ncbi:MAG: FG-GAP repeat domain-containing protein, partial [Planctomycetaceae bacterium]